MLDLIRPASSSITDSLQTKISTHLRWPKNNNGDFKWLWADTTHVAYIMEVLLEVLQKYLVKLWIPIYLATREHHNWPKTCKLHLNTLTKGMSLWKDCHKFFHMSNNCSSLQLLKNILKLGSKCFRYMVIWFNAI